MSSSKLVRLISLQYSHRSGDDGRLFDMYDKVAVSCSYDGQHHKTHSIPLRSFRQLSNLSNEQSIDSTSDQLTVVPLMQECEFKTKQSGDIRPFMNTFALTLILYSLNTTMKEQKMVPIHLPLSGFQGTVQLGHNLSLSLEVGGCDGSHGNETVSQQVTIIQNRDSGFFSTTTSPPHLSAANVKLLEQELKLRDSKIAEMQRYIDQLLGGIMETNPSILERVSFPYLQSPKLSSNNNQATDIRTEILKSNVEK